MQSKPLRQAIDLALDTLGMQGPVTRRQVAEHVVRATNDQSWAIGDLLESKIAFLVSEIAVRMGETHSQHILDQYLPHIPDQYWPVLRGLPRFICVSARGGRNAEHVMSIFATPSQWAANAELKGRIVEAVAVKRDEARRVTLLLQSSGAKSIADLCSREAA